MRTLTELEKFMGVITMGLGEIEESVTLFEKCVDRYPDDFEFLYYYGYALLLNGQVSKARYPLHFLYYHCQAVRKRNKDENGRPVYPAQTIAWYSWMSAYMCSDFMIAMKEIDEFERQLFYYQEKLDDSCAVSKQMIQEALNSHYQFRKKMTEMYLEDIANNFAVYCAKWKEYLSAPWGHMAYLYKRGELQVLMDLHTCWADFLLKAKKYDDLIEWCQYMLSVLKDSGTLKLYLARAYALKGDSKLAVRYYMESADMLKYEYPQIRRDGTDSESAHREKVRIRKEMQQLGLDETMIQ